MCPLLVRQMSAPCALFTPFNFNLPHHHILHRRNSYKVFNQPLERDVWCTIINGYFSVHDFSFQKVLTHDTKNLKILVGRMHDFSVKST